ncbi:oxidoreductase alpha (molybdopterin) subunit [Loktanella fryxellensis]|uniref:Oxidoreductase alpha (Molybdopterin) subunit n=1 Tax=Loktanella fryxellensis TaxID=245187 RepID=A0A1H8IT49_9RHOB|nr:FdhF/YdeP family oxidoreductase [Loktanella fryxellensis]SEN71612.1 oxidoreductase alpha (molybdopterin) subunit [Loktanella fryxellensis]
MTTPSTATTPFDPTGQDPALPHDTHAAGGWGSVQSVAGLLREGGGTRAAAMLRSLNKPRGVMCPSCAWAKSAKPHAFEFCDNGAKATLWELDPNRADADFFAGHSLTELRMWHDHDLEKAGRLTTPLRYDAATDRYVPVAWDTAIAEIGAELRAMDPEQAVFYASGHAGLEAAYLYALFARAMGHQNLPQSSNMCHETTSVNLKSMLGTPVGTCTMEDLESADAMFFFGQNTGSNSPRFMHTLKAAVQRGCRIVTFNPVRERGLISFVDPQSVAQMTVAPATDISEKYYQLRPGGDIAVMAGLMKCVLAAEDAAPGTVLDHAFIAEHTEGFDATVAAVRALAWSDITRNAGLTQPMIEEAAAIWIGAKRVIGVYGMGLTQHVNGWLNLGMLCNLLLMGGHMGRMGTGISPVRGHSNVQGQRTVGVGEKSSHMPADKLRSLFGIEPPTKDGMNAVQMCEGIVDGRVKGLVMLGGNLVRALPDRERMEAAWPALRLTVSIATKPNRTHLTPGKIAYLLPCLGRTDEDVQATGKQAVSMEDSLSHISGSIGTAPPPGPQVWSETAIVARLAAATLDPNPALKWDAWAGDYDLIRNLIELTYPQYFARFNDRLFTPGGFYRGNPARDRRWETPSGRAQFTVPTTLSALEAELPQAGAALTLITLRSHDQFNTTIYGFSDRLRGLSGSREIVLISPTDIARLGLRDGQKVTLVCAVDDGIDRRVGDLAVTAYDLPPGCVAGYYPELNPLVPLSHHEERSATPAYKGTPVRIEV